VSSIVDSRSHFDRWRLTAEVLWGPRRVRRAFQLDAAAPMAPIGRLAGQWQPDEVAWLPDRIAALDSAWEVSAGGELVDLGGQGVLVPDLAFRHRDTGARAYLEVLGYWNRGSVARRLELLRRHGPPNLILAVSKSLAAGEEDELGEVPGEVYVYRSTPSARRFVAALDRIAGGAGASSGSTRGRSSAR
jgi:predicted nuclease of restriction endonuclease-like RecB superfamily